jgi:PAS domain S-box-containing protein
VFERLANNYSFLKSYQNAVDTTNAVVIMDARMQITFVNKTFESLSGFSADDVMHTNFSDYFEIQTPRLQTLMKQIQTKTLWHGILKNKTKNGGFYWSDAVINPIVDKQGNIKEYIIIHKDITEQKNAQDVTKELQTQLRHQNNLLQSILDNAPVGIWLNDTQGVPIMQNRWITNNTQMSKEEIAACAKTDAEVLQTAQTGVYNEVVTFTDGKKHTVQTIKTKLTDTEGNTLGVVGIGSDITDTLERQKQLQTLNEKLQDEVKLQVEQLREKDKILQEQAKLAAMGEMISAIAHQWRQPLNALSINIQNLDYDYEEGLIDEAFIVDFIKRQSQTIDFMSKMIDDFRSFFKTDKTKREFSIRDVVVNVAGLVSAQFANNSIKIEIHGDDFIVNGYESEMKQVMLNILSNAKDAVIERKIKNGEVVIGISKKMRKLTVTDNGGGVASYKIDRIFEPYFTTKDHGKGTGIGLFMSRIIIVEHMGATIKGYNVNDGFCVEIGF